MSDEQTTILVRVVGATDVGLVREHNEDNFIVVDLKDGETNFLEPREVTVGVQGVMLVVCDGMGGAAAGEVASHMAVESMRRQLLKYATEQLGPDGKILDPPTGSPPLPPEAQTESPFHRMCRWLRDATAKANLEIWEAACADLSKNGMGTTLTGLLFIGSQIVVSQIGDSRAYLCRQGQLVQITHDQSLVNQLLDSGQITAEQAKLFEHSNVILQALGVQEDIEVVLSHETVRRGDRLLLCSDGLVGVVSDEEIQEVLTSTEDLSEAARKLIDLARSGGGPDNITVIVAQVDGEGALSPTEPAKYQVLTLPGEKPIERRVFGEGYQLGPASGTSSAPSDLAAARQDANSVSLFVWVALFAVVLALVAMALLLVPKRIKPQQRAQCTVLVEPAGVGVWVDPDKSDKPIWVTGRNREQMTLELGVGRHAFVLRRPGDLQNLSSPISVDIADHKPCSLILAGNLVTASADLGTPVDAGRLADAGDLQDAGQPTDAGQPADAGATQEGGSPSDAHAASDDLEDDAGKKLEKKPRQRRPRDKGTTQVAETKTDGSAQTPENTAETKPGPEAPEAKEPVKTPADPAPKTVPVTIPTSPAPKTVPVTIPTSPTPKTVPATIPTSPAPKAEPVKN